MRHPLYMRKIAAIGLALMCSVAATAPASAARPVAVSGEDAVVATAGRMSYLILTPAGATAGPRAKVAELGGRVVWSYPQVGVIVAHAAAVDFPARMRSVEGVQAVGATRTRRIGVQTDSADVKSVDPAGVTMAEVAAPAAELVDWNLRHVGADRAWALNPGSRAVRVAMLDSGIDDTHEDLAVNFDAVNSVSCVRGWPDTRPGAWRPSAGVIDAGHGTATASVVAAARNGRGIVGVAPNVRLASIKNGEVLPGYDVSFVFAEAVVCSYVWAAEHGFAVSNASFFMDPWMYNCPTDRDQAVLITAVNRAVQYAERKGVLNVVGSPNNRADLADKRLDVTSPTDGPPLGRDVTTACKTLPAESPGAVTVSATGREKLRASYSSFGYGIIDVTAPGGDIHQQGDIGVLVAFPSNRYARARGNSIAAPHVTGVAALLKSKHPDATPAQLRTYLSTQANDLPCPAGSGSCKGTTAYNGYFGEGMVDAYKAVTR